MAIWQYNIYLIPRKSLFNRYGQIVQNLNIDEALEIEWWRDINVDIDRFLPILKQFGKIQGWTQYSDSVRSFGEVEADDVSVTFDEKKQMVLEFHCRVDLRKIDREFLNKIFLLAKNFDCLLMDIQGKLFEPTFSAIGNSISLSNSNRFVQDPKLFLDDLGNGFIRPEGRV